MSHFTEYTPLNTDLARILEEALNIDLMTTSR